ncbi:MAG: hypothetical protein U5L74_03300 [Ideonella sp.]|nr:hypothetical protein [Ideonella sp.]
MAAPTLAHRGVRAKTRTPLLLLRLPGVLVLRAERRRLSSLLLNEPPRTTRPEPPGLHGPGRAQATPPGPGRRSIT